MSDTGETSELWYSHESSFDCNASKNCSLPQSSFRQNEKSKRNIVYCYVFVRKMQDTHACVGLLYGGTYKDPPSSQLISLHISSTGEISLPLVASTSNSPRNRLAHIKRLQEICFRYNEKSMNSLKVILFSFSLHENVPSLKK